MAESHPHDEDEPDVRLSVPFAGAPDVHARLLLGLAIPNRFRVGLPGDPHREVDRLMRVDVLAGALAAAAEECEQCLLLYSEQLTVEERDAMRHWVKCAEELDPDVDQTEMTPSLGRNWHRMRHRLLSSSAGFPASALPSASTDRDGEAPSHGNGIDRARMSPPVTWEKLREALQFTQWQMECAWRCGFFPKPVIVQGSTGERLWTHDDLKDVTSRRSEILSVIGTRHPVGANKAAMRLSQRFGFDVDRYDIEMLVDHQILAPIGEYHGWPTYNPAHIEHIDLSDFEKVVAADRELLSGGPAEDDEVEHDKPTEVTANVPLQRRQPVLIGVTAPPCSEGGCGGSRMDRPEAWSQACWSHSTSDEQAEIRAERVRRRDRSKSSQSNTLWVDIESSIDFGCPTCLTAEGEDCQTPVGRVAGLPHEERVLRARGHRRSERVNSDSRQEARRSIPCPACLVGSGEFCVDELNATQEVVHDERGDMHRNLLGVAWLPIDGEEELVVHPVTRLAMDLIHDKRLPQLNTVDVGELEQTIWDHGMAGWKVRDIVGAVNVGVQKYLTKPRSDREIPFTPKEPLSWLKMMLELSGTDPREPFMRPFDVETVTEGERIRNRMNYRRSLAPPILSQEGLEAQRDARSVVRTAKIRGQAREAAARRTAQAAERQQQIERGRAHEEQLARLSQLIVELDRQQQLPPAAKSK